MNLERVISISGSLENMCKAEVFISQKLRQFFDNDMYQYQQSLLYSGLHSPLQPVMAHAASVGSLNLPSGYSPGPLPVLSQPPHSHSHHVHHPLHHPTTHQGPQQHQPLSYSLGPTPSQSLSGRPGVLAGATQGTSVAASGPGQPSSHHLHSIGSPVTASQSAAYYGGYNIPYYYSHGPATATGNIPGAYAATTAPAGSPYHHFSPLGPYLHPAASSVLAHVPQLDNLKESITVFIPNSIVGAIIGRGGQTIREMMNQSGASIKVYTVVVVIVI